MAASNMRRESLTRKAVTADQLKQMYSYDPETGHFTRLRRLGSYHAGTIAGTRTEHGYIAINIGGRPIYAHRLAWLYMTSDWPAKDHIDHINGIRTDNQWANLREAEHSQNLMNRPAPKQNTSGFKGVSFHALTGKWRARINRNRVAIALGLFNTRAEAASAYAEAAARLHGEFAYFESKEPDS